MYSTHCSAVVVTRSLDRIRTERDGGVMLTRNDIDVIRRFHLVDSSAVTTTNRQR